MTSKIVVNNIEADAGVSTVTFNSNVVRGGSNLHSTGLALGAGSTVGAVTGVTTYYGDGSNLTGAAPTINNNAGNKVITGSNTTNTLEAEDTLRYDGTNFLIGTNTEAPYNNRNLTVAAGASGNSTVAIEIRSPSNGTGRVIFSDGTSADSSANEGQVIYQQSDHKMLFGVAANYQNMALESTGGTGADLNIIDGNLKLASGHGIDFSATGNISGTSSELLDDYEEGSWTPVVGGWDTFTPYSGSSYYAGWYVKVGAMVHCGWKIYYQNLSTPSSGGNAHIRISGLPFASKSVSAGPVAAPVRFDISEFGFSGYNLTYLSGNSTVLYMYKHVNGGGHLVAINAANNYSNNWTMGTATYQTDA